MTPALAAQLRIESLGVTVLLFAAGVIAANPRFRASRDVGRLAPMRVELARDNWARRGRGRRG